MPGSVAELPAEGAPERAHVGGGDGRLMPLDSAPPPPSYRRLLEGELPAEGMAPRTYASSAYMGSSTASSGQGLGPLAYHPGMMQVCHVRVHPVSQLAAFRIVRTRGHACGHGISHLPSASPHCLTLFTLVQHAAAFTRPFLPWVRSCCSATVHPRFPHHSHWCCCCVIFG